MPLAAPQQRKKAKPILDSKIKSGDVFGGYFVVTLSCHGRIQAVQFLLRIQLVGTHVLFRCCLW
jgi:hypothetical protein